MKSFPSVHALFLLLAAGWAGAQAKPNVLFVAVDDLRPDLGCYGSEWARTPNIDRLAARSTIFSRAYVAQAVCSPSRTAIMTGLRPDTTKVWDLETHFRAARPDCITLPQHFKENGYHCAALGKVYHSGYEDGRSWSEPHWYAKGRSVDTDPADWTKKKILSHEVNVSEYGTAGTGKAKGAAFEVSAKGDDELPDGATAAEAVKRLHALKEKGKPFFLAVGFLKPHLPFVAPKKYWDLHDPEKIPPPVIEHLPEGAPPFAGHDNGELHGYSGIPSGNPIPGELAKQLRHGYAACVSFTDAQIGRLLDALDREGLAGNTVVVLWGDHGWQLGDHGLWHKHTNFELAARAPLLISVPGRSKAGVKCEAPVEFVDVYPTLADLCGLPEPAGLAGVSLKPFLDDPAAPALKPAMSQYPRSAGKGGAKLMGYSLRDARWRATFWRERSGGEIIATELYDETNDPAETVSLHARPEHAVILEGLAKFLPPVGSSALKAEPEPSSGETREARFDRLYPGKTRLTPEEYLAKQSDAGEGRERFTRMDGDGDGWVSREEFITGGRSKSK